MPKHFKSPRELIYWEYAKIIAAKAVGERLNYKFINFSYHKMLKGELGLSTVLRENQQLFSEGDICAYCGASGNLQWEHIIPLSRGGPDTFDNLVRACAPCNQAKGVRDPYQWYADRQMENLIPRIVWGKFLKLVFDEYAKHGLLDTTQVVERCSLSRIFATSHKSQSDSGASG